MGSARGSTDILLYVTVIADFFIEIVIYLHVSFLIVSFQIYNILTLRLQSCDEVLVVDSRAFLGSFLRVGLLTAIGRNGDLLTLNPRALGTAGVSA